jgi:hypothetical protein
MTRSIEVPDLIQALQYLENQKHLRPGKKAILPGRKIAEGDLNPSPWYGTGLFSFCGDTDIVSLVMEDQAFLKWLQWLPNNEIYRNVKSVTWIGPDGADWATGAGSPGQNTCTSGVMTDLCGKPPSVDWGKCEIRLTKGLYGRCGQPIAAANIGLKYCNSEPIYRVDGTVIDNDAEWQMALAAAVLHDDISAHLITGDPANENEMAGLESLIKTGYIDYRTLEPCPQLDSIILDWAHQGVAGLVPYITEIINRIKLRAKRIGGIRNEDITIMTTSFLRDCIVNEFACEGPCSGGLASPQIVVLNQQSARGDRDRYLTGGANGDGWVPINGEPISFLVNNWIPFQSCPDGGAGSYESDIYILVRRVGNRTVLRGEFQNFSAAAAELQALFGNRQFRVTDGGKFLVWSNNTNTCFETCLMTRPGLYLSAPWAQARITNVCCTSELQPLSPQPCNEYFLGYGQLYSAAPPSGLIDYGAEEVLT